MIKVCYNIGYQIVASRGLLMGKLNILVVEDNALAREVMAENLAGHAVDFAGDKAAADVNLRPGITISAL